MTRPRNAVRSTGAVLSFCIAAILLLVSAAVLVGIVNPPRSNTLEYELRKHIIQFLLVTATGALIAYIVDWAKSRALRIELQRQYRSEAVRNLLDGLDDCYRNVKLARRLFRLIPIESLSLERYDERLLLLNEQQQNLEQLRRDIEALEQRIPELTQLIPRISQMEKYLSSIWTERETVIGAGTCELVDAPRLHSFRAHATKDRKSDFNPNFGDPYRAVRIALVRLLGNTLSGEDTRRTVL